MPASIEQTAAGRKKVTWTLKDGSSGSDEFDTVLFAVGRDVCTGGIGLENTGVELSKDGKVPVVNEQTNVPHIYAIGDVIDGAKLSPPSKTTELTPVAIQARTRRDTAEMQPRCSRDTAEVHPQAGKLLAERLYGGSTALMDYTNVPTTVYTPLEYGAVGLPEEEAEALYGADNIEVYHSYFKPLEWTVPQRGDNACYAKIICNLADSERVVGLHVCGPSAGEMCQGFAVAMKCGATKSHFDNCVGIHPTVVEEFTIMKTTKRSGECAEKTGC